MDSMRTTAYSSAGNSVTKCSCWAAQTKKDRVASWKAAMGQSALGKLAWRWARTCAAAGRRAELVGNSGGGPRPRSAFPDALESSVTPRTVDSFDGRSDGANDGVLDKGQQCACGDAQTSDLVGEPDTEGSSAAVSSMTVAAKDASCPECSLWWVAVVESVENAVAVECADSLAVWT
jgi:hypothetical protein